MTALVTKHIALLSGAPGGVDKLRMLFRRLAVTERLSSDGDPSAKSDWRRTTFGQVFSLEYGDNLPAPKRSGTGEFPVYGSNGVVGSHNECCVSAPCLVVGRKGSAGAVNICEHVGCWVTDVAYSCVPPGDVALRFAFVLFQSLGLDELGKGIKPGLSRSEAYALPVSIPPLAEQHRIVTKVDELMALCDRLEARQQDAEAAHARLVQALLDSLTQARDADEFQACWQRVAVVFCEMFTTADTVDALEQVVLQSACSGRLITSNTHHVTEASPRYLLEAAVVPPAPFVIPSNWRWARLGDLCSLITSGSRGWKEFYAEHGSTFIRSQDIKFDRLEFDQRAFVALPPNAEGARTQVHRDDLLITITGANVGKCAVLNEAPEDAYVSQHVALVRLHDPQQAEYIHRWLINGCGGRRLLLSSSYGAKPGLNLQNLKDLPVPLPPLAEQHRIVAKVTELLALCDQLKARIAAARAKHAQLAEALVAQAVAA